MSEKIVVCEFYSFAPPSEEEKTRLSAFLEKKIGSPVELKWVKDESVKKGFILKVLNEIYENTPEGFIKSLKTQFPITSWLRGAACPRKTKINLPLISS